MDKTAELLFVIAPAAVFKVFGGVRSERVKHLSDALQYLSHLAVGEPRGYEPDYLPIGGIFIIV